MPHCSQISEGYFTRTPGVKQASYGSLQHVHMELGNSETALPGNGVRACQHAGQRAEAT